MRSEVYSIWDQQYSAVRRLWYQNREQGAPLYSADRDGPEIPPRRGMRDEATLMSGQIHHGNTQELGRDCSSLDYGHFRKNI